MDTKTNIDDVNADIFNDESVMSDMSSIDAPFVMKDPLIVAIGIGDYDTSYLTKDKLDLHSIIDCVTSDYNNIIGTFVDVWKHKVFYQLTDNNIVYSNDIISNSETNFKLKWNEKEITTFIQNAAKCIVENKHDGVLFFISSFGTDNKGIYDGNGMVYQLDNVFDNLQLFANLNMNHKSHFQRKHTQDFKPYLESKQYLLTIPKIFIVDIGRTPKMQHFTI